MTDKVCIVCGAGYGKLHAEKCVRYIKPSDVSSSEISNDLIQQLCSDLNEAHDELMKVQGADDCSKLDWPEWSPQANSIRNAEKILGKKLAKTDQWTLYPCQHLRK